MQNVALAVSNKELHPPTLCPWYSYCSDKFASTEIHLMSPRIAEFQVPVYNTPAVPTPTKEKLKPTGTAVRPIHDYTDGFWFPCCQGITTEDVLADCSRLPFHA